MSNQPPLWSRLQRDDHARQASKHAAIWEQPTQHSQKKKEKVSAESEGLTSAPWKHRFCPLKDSGRSLITILSWVTINVETEPKDPDEPGWAERRGGRRRLWAVPGVILRVIRSPALPHCSSSLRHRCRAAAGRIWAGSLLHKKSALVMWDSPPAWWRTRLNLISGLILIHLHISPPDQSCGRWSWSLITTLPLSICRVLSDFHHFRTFPKSHMRTLI